MTDAPMQTSAQTTKGALHVTTQNFEATLNNPDHKPVFIDFSAEWCPPCKLAAPIVEKLADEYRDRVIVAKLDVDESNQLAAQHGVMSIPTVLVFKDGKEVDRKIGFPGESGYRQMLDKVAPAA